MSIHFSCTLCGRCCHDLRLPLAIDEALVWLAHGGDVQLFCDAIVWPQEPPESDALAQHRRRRSFGAHSGTLPIRVTVTLVAAFAGACPNLRADMTCGAYDRRPRVCRIYPAEVNPFVPLDPAAKACPPEAWADSGPLLTRAGKIVDADTAALVAQSREANERDRFGKAYLCALLGYDAAALANEGFAIYAPERSRLEAALREAERSGAQADEMQPHDWRFITNRSSTLSNLRSIGATAGYAQDSDDSPGYLGFFDAETGASDQRHSPDGPGTL
ncbi:YkgJ family cysteine cluster protein [Paraburkholderia sp. C35]|uniref:YkgJ family cysteine cluster protein n=1 Tax=Paraburkholderia sp. C35 TaxID=2126993 RepID=UPI000D6A0550|nr:YkgJ family cysteine cluster protein [Paraburkholderia sp. C35]